MTIATIPADLDAALVSVLDAEGISSTSPAGRSIADAIRSVAGSAITAQDLDRSLTTSLESVGVPAISHVGRQLVASVSALVTAHLRQASTHRAPEALPAPNEHEPVAVFLELQARIASRQTGYGDPRDREWHRETAARYRAAAAALRAIPTGADRS
ncbi:hypothetical protein [Rathayibacter sp. AY1E1]|uniref:hypothetical protein n=1 Tax=Rathayibacter sp. AY1E1 TaxID=2080549 RepID=UPI000CE8BE67|nr:hypothetical protein [Rathayibacter sp. AY1E1]PPH51209.1 hypothetical protein C5C67_11885 [Rathayibacter sp. AY1E1]